MYMYAVVEVWLHTVLTSTQGTGEWLHSRFGSFTQVPTGHEAVVPPWKLWCRDKSCPAWSRNPVVQAAAGSISPAMWRPAPGDIKVDRQERVCSLAHDRRTTWSYCLHIISLLLEVSKSKLCDSAFPCGSVLAWRKEMVGEGGVTVSRFL
jgi:hypothetical protein